MPAKVFCIQAMQVFRKADCRVGVRVTFKQVGHQAGHQLFKRLLAITGFFLKNDRPFTVDIRRFESGSCHAVRLQSQSQPQRMLRQLAPEVGKIRPCFGVVLTRQTEDDPIENTTRNFFGSVIDHVLQKVGQAESSVRINRGSTRIINIANHGTDPSAGQHKTCEPVGEPDFTDTVKDFLPIVRSFEFHLV